MVAFVFRLLTAGFVLAVAAYPLADKALARGNLTTSYKYYPVSGKTAASLHRSMTVPTGFFSSEKVYANITMKSSFKGHFVRGKTCRIKGFGIDAKFIVRLPRLSKGAKLSPHLKRQFRNFSSYVRKHELTHRSIWTRCLRSAERRIMAIRYKNCNKLDSAAAKIILNEWAKCETRNVRFDKLEQKRLLRLSLVKAALKPARSVRSAHRKPTRSTRVLAKPGYRRTLGKAND